MPAPLTAFEKRGRVAPWTSLSEGATYLSALTAYSDKFTRETVGQSALGAPMELFKIGTGPTKVLWTAQQHGGEVSGREAIFTKMREWADSTNPAILDYFQRVTLLIMPTCHPDNTHTRENVNGVNLNRDHVQLTQPETQAIQSVIRDHQPELVLDWHEGANIKANYATARPYNTNSTPEILALSQEVSDKVRGVIEGAGYTWELYQGPGDMMLGPENLHNNAAVRDTVSLLLETRRAYGTEADAALRHDLHLLAVDAVVEWHAANLERATGVVTAARGHASSRTGTLTLMTGTSSRGPASSGIDGYRLTADQHAAVEVHRDRFALQSIPDGDGHIVPAKQQGRVILTYLLDPASAVRAVDGVPYVKPLPEQPPAPTPAVPLVAIGRNVRYKFKTGGVVYPATLKVHQSAM